MLGDPLVEIAAVLMLELASSVAKLVMFPAGTAVEPTRVARRAVVMRIILDGRGD